MREKVYGQKMWLAAVDGLLEQAEVQLEAFKTDGLDDFLEHCTPGEQAAIAGFVRLNGLPALEKALTGYMSVLRLKAAGLKTDISSEK